MGESYPWRAEAWEWDDGNESELAAHRISAVEVEQVWDSDAKFIPNVADHPGDWKMLGLTNGGRRLTIIVRFDSNRLCNRAITGWDATTGERTKYF